jgi:hypothetical protein
MNPLLQKAFCEFLHGQLMLRGAVSLGDAGVIGVRRAPGGIVRAGGGRVKVSPPSDQIQIQSSSDGFEPDLVVREQDVLSMLSLKTGMPLQQVETSFREWVQCVRGALKGGKPVDLEPLGRFDGSSGTAGFIPSQRFANEVNHRFAGLQEIELANPGDEMESAKTGVADLKTGVAGSVAHSGSSRRFWGGLVASAVVVTLMLAAGLYLADDAGWRTPSLPWAFSSAEGGEVHEEAVPASRDEPALAAEAEPAPPAGATDADEGSSDALASIDAPETASEAAGPPAVETTSETADTSAGLTSDAPYGLFGSFDPDLRNAYTLVLFTFSESDRAANAAVPLIDAGYRLEIVTRWKGDQPFWLLCVGQFENRQQALAALETLDEPYRSDYAVLLLP